MEDWHTYYVDEEGALVHNQCENILSDDANVVRGGINSVERFVNGSGVTVDAKGRLNGVSVNSKNNLSVETLSEGISNGKIGTTTVGHIRKLGENVVPSPTKENPNHSILFGITAEEAEKLFTPVIKNPALKKR